MHPKTLHLLNTLTLLTLSTAPSTLVQAVSDSTVPEPCKAICNPIVELTNTCDVDPMEGMIMRKREVTMEQAEQMESECICKNKSFDVSSVMGLCASCMGQNSDSGNKSAVQGVDFLSNFLLARGA